MTNDTFIWKKPSLKHPVGQYRRCRVRQMFAGSHPSGPPANRKDQGETEMVKETRDEASGFEILEQCEHLPREEWKAVAKSFLWIFVSINFPISQNLLKLLIFISTNGKISFLFIHVLSYQYQGG